MKIERENLMRETLLDSGADLLRSQTLAAGGKVLRRRRRRRIAMRVLPIFTLLGILVFAVSRFTAPHSSLLVSNSAVPIKHHSLTDRELLDLFPDTPVGIAVVNGKKILIFLRKEDEARFVGHL